MVVIVSLYADDILIEPVINGIDFAEWPISEIECYQGDSVIEKILSVEYRYRERPKVFHCYSCKNTFSPFTDTIFKKTHIDIRLWFYTIHLFLNGRKGISGCQLKRELGTTYVTAFRILKQIRTAMGNCDLSHEFSELVEVDETYVGGKPRKGNAILNSEGKVVKIIRPPIKRGRGTKKIPVVGVKERASTRVYAQVMLPNSQSKKLTGKQLLEVIDKVCTNEKGKKTTVASDDFRSYKILEAKEQKDKYIHITVNHSLGQYNAGNGVHTNGIENFWSVLKRGIIGIYHHVSLKYLQKYLDEFCFRQNTRKREDLGFEMLIEQCILT
jgi:transposase-like protein